MTRRNGRYLQAIYRNVPGGRVNSQLPNKYNDFCVKKDMPNSLFIPTPKHTLCSPPTYVLILAIYDLSPDLSLLLQYY